MSSRKPAVSIRRAPTADPRLVERFVTGDRIAAPSVPPAESPAIPEFESLASQAPAPSDVRGSGPSDSQRGAHPEPPAPEVPAVRNPETPNAPQFGDSSTPAAEDLNLATSGRAAVQDSASLGSREPGSAASRARQDRETRESEPSDLGTSGRAEARTSGIPNGEPAGMPESRAPTTAPRAEGPSRPPQGEPTAASIPAAARRGLVRRQDGRVRRRMTVYLPPEIVAQLTAMTMYDGRELSEVIEDAVRSYVIRS